MSVFGLAVTPSTLSHSTKDIPQCWQDCLKSNDMSCNDTDYNCGFLLFFPDSLIPIVIDEPPPQLTSFIGICSSAPSHLSSFLACVDSKCSDASAYLSSLRETCPISTSQLSSVESIVTDVAHPTLLLASPTSHTGISTTTVTGSAALATTTATPTTTSTSTSTPTSTANSDDGGGQGGGDGTVLDLEGGGRKKEGGCLLGLTVGILAGIAWF